MVDMLDRVALEKKILRQQKANTSVVQYFHQKPTQDCQKQRKLWRRYRQGHQWKAYKTERNIYNCLLTLSKKQELTHQIKSSEIDIRNSSK